jgi:hypothetical protein
VECVSGRPEQVENFYPDVGQVVLGVKEESGLFLFGLKGGYG